VSEAEVIAELIPLLRLCKQEQHKKNTADPFVTDFEDEHYFCRLFRHKTGVTPAQLRKQLKEPAAG